MRDNFSFYEGADTTRNLSVVQIPLEIGSDQRGLAQAPAYIYDRGVEKMAKALGFDIARTSTVDCPSLPPAVFTGTPKYLDEIAVVAGDVARMTAEAAKRGDIVVALGGDHASAYGSISGAASGYKQMGLIWIDAHPDAHTPETMISGNVHGMVAASMMGFGDPKLTDIHRQEVKVGSEDMLYIGLKDFDQAEIELLRREKIEAFTMLDIAQHGLSPVLRAITALQRRVDAVWVSFDMDSIDKRFAPGVAMQNAAGLTRREALSLSRYIGKSCKLAGLDIVEMLPSKDRNFMTADLALELIALLLGGEYNWYTAYMDNYRELNGISREAA